MLDQNTTNDMAQDGDIFIVESILNRRLRKNRVEYLIKWAGWDSRRHKKRKHVSPVRNAQAVPRHKVKSVDVYDFEPDHSSPKKSQELNMARLQPSNEISVTAHVVPIKLKIRLGRDDLEEPEISRSSPGQETSPLDVSPSPPAPTTKVTKRKKKRPADDSGRKHHHHHHQKHHHSKRSRMVFDVVDASPVTSPPSSSRRPLLAKSNCNLTDSSMSPVSLRNGNLRKDNVEPDKSTCPFGNRMLTSLGFRVDNVISNVTVLEVRAFNNENVTILEFDDEESFFRTYGPEQPCPVAGVTSFTSSPIKQERLDTSDSSAEIETGDPVVQAAYSGCSLSSTLQSFATFNNNSTGSISPCKDLHSSLIPTVIPPYESMSVKQHSEGTCEDDESFIDIVNVPTHPIQIGQSDLTSVSSESANTITQPYPSGPMVSFNNPMSMMSGTSNSQDFLNAFSASLLLPFMAMQAVATAAAPMYYPSLLSSLSPMNPVALSVPPSRPSGSLCFTSEQQSMPENPSTNPTSYMMSSCWSSNRKIPSYDVMPTSRADDCPLDLTVRR